MAGQQSLSGKLPAQLLTDRDIHDTADSLPDQGTRAQVTRIWHLKNPVSLQSLALFCRANRAASVGQCFPLERSRPLCLTAARRQVSTKPRALSKAPQTPVISTAQACSGLESGNICAVSDVGVASDSPNSFADDVTRRQRPARASL